MDKPDKIWATAGAYPNFGDEDWVCASASAKHKIGDVYLLATPERELASELVGTLWQWLELAERTMEDHVHRLDANRAADFSQGIRETKAVLAKLDKGE